MVSRIEEDCGRLYPSRSPLMPNDFLKNSLWSVSSGNGNRWDCTFATKDERAAAQPISENCMAVISACVGHPGIGPAKTAGTVMIIKHTFANSLFFWVSSELMPNTSAPTSLNLP